MRDGAAIAFFAPNELLVFLEGTHFKRTKHKHKTGGPELVGLLCYCTAVDMERRVGRFTTGRVGRGHMKAGQMTSVDR